MLLASIRLSTVSFGRGSLFSVKPKRSKNQESALRHLAARRLFGTMVAEYGGILLGSPVPTPGRSRTMDYTITGEHMAERCQLFVMGVRVASMRRHYLVKGADVAALGESLKMRDGSVWSLRREILRSVRLLLPLTVSFGW